MSIPTPGGGPWLRMQPSHPCWPALLKEIPDPPLWLEVGGDATTLTRPALAVVGTRRATPRGLAIAHALGMQAALQGWTVVSGLALGIDAAAHRGALAGGGLTVGVMGTGLDRTFPRQHQGLRHDIEQAGCSLSEYPPGTPPLKHHFPRRNRLIAGLVRAVIVVEAPLRSGAMITARLALDYDREVLAVPGPVDLEVSRGCHQLLRQGAALVESWADVANAVGPGPEGVSAVASGVPMEYFPPESCAAWILDRLDLAGVKRDDLRRAWGGTEDTWQQGLLALEMKGLIRRLPGGRLARSIWVP